MIASGGFLEYARVLDHWYGTPKRPIQQALARGRSILLGIDIQGARQVRQGSLPAVTIFLLPPSTAALGRRLKKRGTETPAQIRARLKLARTELREADRYDYQVVNDRLADAVAAVRAIVKAERFRVNR